MHIGIYETKLYGKKKKGVNSDARNNFYWFSNFLKNKKKIKKLEELVDWCEILGDTVL